MSDTDSDTASSVGSIIEEASEPDTTSFKCLFCNEQWNRVADMSLHCKSEHGFDLENTIKSLGPDADEIVVIKLINFLRLEAQKTIEPKSIKLSLDDLADDKYLQPTLPEDALLFELGDLMPEPDSKAVDYDEYEAAMNREIPEGVAKLSAENTRDDSYFESYKGAGIHREMIEDHVRTQGYRDFIEKNADVFAGKIVLDVGCGTGILSLFCARAGAKKVFAVDNSDIAIRAKEIITHNGYQDRIQVIQGRAEDFNTQRLIGKEKVDIIISEWMGYGLLFEGMLDSVLRARDMYLKEGGIMVPSHTTLRLAPIADPEWIADTTGEKFWKQVHGFDFSPMIPNATLTAKEIGVFDVPEKSLCGSPSTFNVLDLAKISIEQLDFVVPFKTEIKRDVNAIEAFAIWFDTLFIPPGKNTDPAAEHDWGMEGIPGVGFSTGPAGKATHWHQAVLVLDKSVAEAQKFSAGTVLEGTIQYAKPRKDARGIDVTIKWQGKGGQGEISGQVMRTM